MENNKDFSTEKSAGIGLGIGATAGLIKGGSIGIAGFGGAIGIPLFVPLACVGTIAGLIYGSYKKMQKNQNNETKNHGIDHKNANLSTVFKTIKDKFK